MSELKISEASQKAAADEIDNANTVCLRAKVQEGSFVQALVNSELDRLAGPLVEALRHVGVTEEILETCAFESQIDGSDCTEFLKQALANYRKERGE